MNRKAVNSATPVKIKNLSGKIIGETFKKIERSVGPNGYVMVELLGDGSERIFPFRANGDGPRDAAKRRAR